MYRYKRAHDDTILLEMKILESIITKLTERNLPEDVLKQLMRISVKGQKIALKWPQERLEDDHGESVNDSPTSIFARFLTDSMQEFEAVESDRRALLTAFTEVNNFVLPQQGQQVDNVAATPTGDTTDQIATTAAENMS